MLKMWRDCPKRWWLTNSEYENTTGTPYPSRITSYSVHGIAVHSALYEFGKLLGEAGFPSLGSDLYSQVRNSFNVRETLRKSIENYIQSISDNPRIILNKLINRINLNDCINYFKLLVNSSISGCQPQVRNFGVYNGDFIKYDDYLPPVASERLIVTEKPPLKVRIDRYILSDGGFVLREVKTGMASDEHIEQAKLYALTIWLKTGKLPQEVSLEYPSGRLVLPPPDLNYLRQLEKNITEEIDNYCLTLKSSNVLGIPSVTNCQFCDVRQLCDEYWNSSTATLVKIDEDRIAMNKKIENLTRVDMEIRFKKPRFVGGISDKHVYDRHIVKVDVGVRYIPYVAETVIGCRLLSVKVASEGNVIRLVADEDSELFWIPKNRNY